MSPMMVRVIAAVLCVVFVAIIVVRRKSLAAKRKPIP
jgi:hypothetical protein